MHVSKQICMTNRMFCVSGTSAECNQRIEQRNEEDEHHVNYSYVKINLWRYELYKKIP